MRVFAGNQTRRVGLGLVLLLVAALLAGCSSKADNSVFTPGAVPSLAPTNTPVPATPLPAFGLNAAQGSGEIKGNGSTFSQDVYTKWIAEFNKVAPNVKISYNPPGAATGSGNGRNDFIANNNDFAGSDAPFAGDQLVKATTAKGDIVHIPTVVGAVVAVYRVDEIKKGDVQPELRLSGPLLADIFLGKVKSWNDAAIKAENPTLNLPNLPIKVVVRNDSSGTTELFKRYLSVVSDEFRDKVDPNTANGTAPNLGSNYWAIPNPTKAEGNSGVADAVANTNGAIGYVDQGVAEGRNPPLTYASIRNKTGRYININPKVNANYLDAITAAAQGVAVPDDFRIFVVNGEGENTYPISGFTYIIVPRDLSKIPNASPDKAKGLVSFLWWSLHDGQRSLPAGFAPLPAALVARLEYVIAGANNNDPLSLTRSLVYAQKPFLS